MAWAQSSLPPCPETGVKHNCFEATTFDNGDTYVGEYQNNVWHGQGVYIYSKIGIRYEGGWVKGKPAGRGVLFLTDGIRIVGEWSGGKTAEFEGIEYKDNGAVIRSGWWRGNTLVRGYFVDPKRYPFIQTRLAAEAVAEQKNRDEKEQKLAAEVEAERKKRQELDAQRRAEIEAERKKRQDFEQKLVEAEAKERERQQVPQPQRPQVALRNERRLALVIGNSSYKVSPLDNPANDANDVAESLKKFGFQTTLVRNATLGQMREATRNFADNYRQPMWH